MKYPDCPGQLRAVFVAIMLGTIAGCQQGAAVDRVDATLRDHLARYADTRRAVLRGEETAADQRRVWPAALDVPIHGQAATDRLQRTFTLGVLGDDVPSDQLGTTTQPATAAAPEGYWRRNLLHQMGYEAKHFGGRGFWRGFKTVFWDVENAIVLTATMGASITIRETGVDGTIRNRTHGNRQLGDADEPIQLLGHPATHFAGTGVLWLTSTLTKDVEQHELARSLTQALAVNGVTTMLLKTAANTTAPNGDEMAWPSGHTSSAFTVAAVLNERYGPMVGVPSLALAGLVGYQRIDSRVHDFSDVVFGAMLGYVVGSSIARDEKARFPEVFGMQVVPLTDPYTGATGLALMKRW